MGKPFLFVLLLLLLPGLALAFGPQITINGVAVLNTTSNQLLNGTLNVTTSFWDSSSGGSQLGGSVSQNVSVNSGNFQYTINFSGPTSYQTFYVLVNISGMAQPRFQYTASAQALNSNSSNSSDYWDGLGDPSQITGLTSSNLNSVNWVTLQSYPSACNQNETITTLGDTITCSPIFIKTFQITDYVPDGLSNQSGSGNVSLMNGNANVSLNNLFIDNTNGRVGIRNTTPNVALRVTGNISAENITALNTFAGPGTGLTGTAASLNIGGNAATATALAADGTNCAANTFPLGVDSSGNAQSCGNNISGNSATATALAANGANCAAGTFPLGVDASGAAESCSSSINGNAATASALSNGVYAYGNGAIVVNGNDSNYLAGKGSSYYINQSGMDASNVTTGTLAVARGGTGVTSSTGSGSVVLNNTPTITSPTIVGTGSITASSGVFTTATVGGSNVCRADGTNCPSAATQSTGWDNTSGKVMLSVNASNVSIGLGPTVFIDNTNNQLGIEVTPGAALDINSTVATAIQAKNSTGSTLLTLTSATGDLNIQSGILKIAGTNRITNAGVGSFASGTTINSVNVCLADGTNCPVTINSAGGWTNTSTTVSLANAANNVSAGALSVDNTNNRITETGSENVTQNSNIQNGNLSMAGTIRLYNNGTATLANGTTIGGLSVCLGDKTGCPSTLSGANTTGAGTTNTIALWSSATGLGNSIMTQSSGNLTIAGNLTINNNLQLLNAPAACPGDNNWMIQFAGINSTCQALNATAITLNSLGGTLNVSKGGTGLTGSFGKGDLLVGNSTGGLNNISVGTDGKVLVANSTATNGVAWQTVAGGSSSGGAALVLAGNTRNDVTQAFLVADSQVSTGTYNSAARCTVVSVPANTTWQLDTIWYNAAQTNASIGIAWAVYNCTGGGRGCTNTSNPLIINTTQHTDFNGFMNWTAADGNMSGSACSSGNCSLPGFNGGQDYRFCMAINETTGSSNALRVTGSVNTAFPTARVGTISAPGGIFGATQGTASTNVGGFPIAAWSSG